LNVTPLEKGRKKSNKTVYTDGLSAMSNRLVVLPKSLRIIPDRFFTKLVFQGFGTATITSPSVHAAFRYIPTAAYDVDPGLGSAAMPGFADFANFYQTYRVTVSRIRAEMVSKSSTNAVEATLIALNTDPGSSPSFTTVASWAGNPYSQQKILSLAGGPPTSYDMQMPTERIFGSKEVYFDDNFNSLVTGTPVNNWYWALGLIADTAPASPLTVSSLIRIEVGVEFFDRSVQEI
jgi:hypothetical protein